jgi:hypothetical protein
LKVTATLEHSCASTVIEDEEDTMDEVRFVSGGGGSEIALMDRNEVVGTVQECAPGRPLIIRFMHTSIPLHVQANASLSNHWAPPNINAAASATFSISNQHASSAIAPAVPFPITGRHVRAVLRSLWYQHSEADSVLEKAIRITAQDAQGRRSQAVVGLHIEPNFCPTICVDPPTDVYYRHRAYPELRNNLMPLFMQASLEDDDTENVGKCTMSLEPYDGITADDVLDLARPTQAWPPALRRFTFVEHPVDPSRTSICYDGREMAWCVSSIVGAAEAPRGNALHLTIKTGTALSVCTLVMRLLAYAHKEAQPRRTHARQYMFRFNAGDEDVPDTRVVFSIHVNPPLMSILPIHNALRFREGTSGLRVLPQPLIGVQLNTPCAGDVLRVTLRDAQPHDVMVVQPTETVLIDERSLVATLAYAKQLSSVVSGVTPGLAGVLIGTVRPMSDTEFEIAVDKQCLLPTTVIAAALRTIVFRNTSNNPSDAPREVLVTWYRHKTKECGYVTLQASVEPEDDMTEVTLATSVVSCFAYEECRFAYGAVVADADTPVFESGSSMDCEVQGLPCDAPPTLSVAVTDFKVTPEGKLTYKERQIGLWKSEPPRKLHVEFTDCPLDVLERLVGSIALTSTDRQRNSKVLQLTLRGSPAVTPTVENVQINVLPRALSFASQAPLGYPYGSGYAPLFPRGLSVAPISYSGATVVIALATQQNSTANGVAAASRRPNTTGTFTPTPEPPANYRAAVNGVDRIALLEPEGDDWTVTKTAVVNRASGNTVCSLDMNTAGTVLTIGFPKTAKVPPAVVASILSLVGFECDRNGTPPPATGDAATPKAGSSAKPAAPKAQAKPTAQAVPAGAAVDTAGLEGTIRMVMHTSIAHVESVARQTDYRYVEIQV